MHLLPGLCPGPRWGSLQHYPRPPSWIWGRGGRRGRGRRGREGRGKGVRVGPQNGRLGSAFF